MKLNEAVNQRRLENAMNEEQKKKYEQLSTNYYNENHRLGNTNPKEEIVLSVSHIIYIYLRVLLLTFIAMALAVLIQYIKLVKDVLIN
jgi:hypothetical protein